MDIDRSQLASMVEAALEEDIGSGDATTESLVPAAAAASAEIVSQGEGILSGMAAAKAVFRALDPHAHTDGDLEDGDTVKVGSPILRVRGSGRALLTGERTALNFLGRLSGIATLTRAFVEAVEGTGVEILDTRKTTPLWRSLEKYAVRCGGGRNHRMGLHDGAMLKENHLAFLGSGDDAWREAVEAARQRGGGVIVEVRGEDDALRAARAGADGVLLDNFSLQDLARVIPSLRSAWGERPFIEVSGGVTLQNVREIADCRPDRISVGALTHSAPALDLSMTVRPDRP